VVQIVSPELFLLTHERNRSLHNLKFSMAELTSKERPGLGSLTGAPVLLKQGFMQQKSLMGFKKRYFRLLQDSVCCFARLTACTQFAIRVLLILSSDRTAVQLRCRRHKNAPR
jgi:hypothetical protein